MDIEQIFGNKLKTMRKERKLSQEELALRMGVDQAYISRIEAGDKDVRLMTIARLANALECTASELMQGVAIEAE